MKTLLLWVFLIVPSIANAEIYQGIDYMTSLGDLKSKYPNGNFTENKPAWLKEGNRFFRLSGNGISGEIIIIFEDLRFLFRTMAATMQMIADGERRDLSESELQHVTTWEEKRARFDELLKSAETEYAKEKILEWRKDADQAFWNASTQSTDLQEYIRTLNSKFEDEHLANMPEDDALMVRQVRWSPSTSVPIKWVVSKYGKGKLMHSESDFEPYYDWRDRGIQAMLDRDMENVDLLIFNFTDEDMAASYKRVGKEVPEDIQKRLKSKKKKKGKTTKVKN